MARGVDAPGLLRMWMVYLLLEWLASDIKVLLEE